MSEPRKWKVWVTADKLEEMHKLGFYPNITPQVVSILRLWGSKWANRPGWMSLLDKGSLLHEMEESIVAIHHLFEAMENSKDTFIAVDVCGGKGLFSFLLSYLKPPKVDQIVLLEKAKINWRHMHEANETAEEEGRPKIAIWSSTNLHDYDSVLDRFLQLPHPVAMTGIHLCKQLSPSFCGLVNGLGPQKCIYACLAPCCLPRAVTAQKNAKKDKNAFSVSIQLKETPQDRQSRRDYMQRRERVKQRKPKNIPCFHCKDETHELKQCQKFLALPKEERVPILQAEHAATIPCWNCLQLGHYKSECPSPVTSKNSRSVKPPMYNLNVSNILQAKRPFGAYCHLLTESLQDRRCQVIEAELETQAKHDDNNWNGSRKSIFIVAR